MKRGEITIPIMVAVSCAITACGIIASYYVSKIEDTRQFGNINKDIAVLQENKKSLEMDVDEIKDNVKDLNRKMDALISTFQIKVKEEIK